MKTSVSVALILLCAPGPVTLSAPPGVAWERVLGGTSRQEARSLQQPAGGRYVLAGRTRGPAGMSRAGAFGAPDFWPGKLDAAAHTVLVPPSTLAPTDINGDGRRDFADDVWLFSHL